jgi:hypothetical protein
MIMPKPADSEAATMERFHDGSRRRSWHENEDTHEFVIRILNEHGLNFRRVKGDGWCWATALLAGERYAKANTEEQRRLLGDSAWIDSYTRNRLEGDAEGQIEDCATGRLIKELGELVVRL